MQLILQARIYLRAAIPDKGGPNNLKSSVLERSSHLHFEKRCNLLCRERVGIYRQLVAYMKEHFGDDARGRQKAWHFLPWHFSFLCRYRRARPALLRDVPDPVS